ncbi:MAG TPA: hypothetical protein VNS58_25660 [Puia sp.]|nr:hypothetical protein [Puia sp.]
MSKKKRALRTTIFIACEGRNTEPIYLEKIVEEIEDQGVFAVTIYPDKSDDSPVSHALGLVQEARSRINDFDVDPASFYKIRHGFCEIGADR